MFDTLATSRFGSTAEDFPPSAYPTLPNIDDLSEGQLILLMDLVQSRLPPAQLSGMNLEEELVRQLQRAKALQARTLDDVEVPANQKAAVLNAVAGAIGSLVEMQEALYNAERFKAIEAIMIEALKVLPEDVATKFLDEYENLAR